MNNNGNDPKKKKKGGKALLAAPVLALAALLLSFGDRLGIGSGSGLGLFEQKNEPAIAAAYEEPASQENPAQTAPVAEQPPAQNETPLIIEVNEDNILYDGATLTADELKERVLALNKPDFVWKLMDNHAKKAVYDQVKGILTECAVTFTES